MPAQQLSPRQAKRARQREQNIARAASMHQARLAWLDSKEASHPLAEQSNLHIGCSGWFYWDWKNCFYTGGLPTSQWFGHYMSHFDTVELNAPFYGWPTLSTVKTWRRQAKDRPFVYTVKVNELITHIKRFEGTKTLIKDFGLIADVLGPHMGCFLFQLPPVFHYTPARLDKLISQIEPHRRNVLEFRHASWWNADVYKACRKANVIFCSTSGPKLPDKIVRTADEIYVRFHGPLKWYRHDYSHAELADWASRIRQSGAKRVWAYFNNDYGCNAIRNAQALRSLLHNDGRET